MRSIARPAALVLAGLLGVARAASPLPAPLADTVVLDEPLLALTHVELWDGSGAPPLRDATLLVRQGRIAALGVGVAIPKEAKVLDLSGHSLSPGFVMVHEHLFYPLNRGSYGAMFNSFPTLYIAGGATTVRTAGSMSPYADLNLQADIAAGRMIGPDLDVTAPFFNGVVPFVMQVPRVGSAEQVREQVGYWAGLGATSYKGYMTLKREHLAALVEAAHARGHKVTAHLCGVSYREAADLGIDNLEHGFVVASDFVEGKLPDQCPGGGKVEAALAALPVDSPAMAALQRHLIERKVAVTSTLTIFETYTPGRPIAPKAALELLSPDLRENYLSRWSMVAGQAGSVWSTLFPKAMAWEKQFVEAGGLLLAGTDPTGYGGVIAGFSNVRELELLEEAGLSRAQALRVGTLNGAVYLGRDREVGSLAVGKRADLVLFKGSLATEPGALRQIVWTMKAGVAYDRARLLQLNRGKVGLE